MTAPVTRRVERYEDMTRDLVAIARATIDDDKALPRDARAEMLRSVPAIDHDATDYLVALHFITARGIGRRRPL